MDPAIKCPSLLFQTKFIFDQFPKARTVQVRKEGFLGIMVIYGKHAEVGCGIFISDLREGSNAELAGVKVGDMLLAVNQDVTLESNYDDVSRQEALQPLSLKPFHIHFRLLDCLNVPRA